MGMRQKGPPAANGLREAS